MILRPGFLRIFIMMTLLAFLPAAPALAACSDLERMGTRLPAGYEIGQVQAGLRAALQDPNRNLKDGKLGRYTRAALRRLCVAVPRAGNEKDVTSTLDLTVGYAELESAVPLWAEKVFAPEFAAALEPKDKSETALAMRLAATTPMRAAAIGVEKGRLNCARIASFRRDATDASRAVAILSEATPPEETRMLCATMPLNGSGADFNRAVAYLRALEQSFPGALRDLNSADFARWINAKPSEAAAKLRRLLGTQPAIRKLLAEFRAQRRPAEESADKAPAPTSQCVITREGGTINYTSFGEQELELLSEPADLAPVFAGLKDYEAKTPAALRDKLLEALAGAVPDCALASVGALVTGPDRLGEMFRLEPKAAADLALVPLLQADLEAISGFEGIEAETKEALIAAIRAVLTTRAAEGLKVEVDLAAESFAAVSEPVDPLLDTRPDDAPPWDNPLNSGPGCGRGHEGNGDRADHK